jgi:cation diffusion facilitator CzcD-associated flavoprotein CzcO
VDEEVFDVAVVGGGQGGIYAWYRFDLEGLSVVGIDGGSNFGGVWYHNRYPGSRVDTDSVDYCFHFSKEIYEKWRWPVRYAAADALLEYLNFVADTLGVRRLFRFDTWLRESQWSSRDDRWHLVTHRGDRIACRFLVMCTGNLSEPKPVSFPGVERFKGEWVQTNRWPEGGVPLAGRRIGIIGTGSSGAQAVPVVAEAAEHLFVFQRHPHYGIPACNRPTASGLQDSIARDLEAERERLLTRRGIRSRGMDAPRPVADFTPEERLAMLERQWESGGHGMSQLFADEGTDRAANEVVAEFVRDKIRQRVADPVVAEKLCPRYPIGTRRLILEIGYYEAFNRENVTLVDVLEDPIVEVTETGVRTAGAEYGVDLLIFAMGFQAFRGAIDSAGIRNEQGLAPRDAWARGPRTLFGLMTPGFPNLFHPTNAGSPSVLGNAMLQHEFLADWVADCIAYMGRSGYSSVEASEPAADEWGRIVASYAERLLRRQENQYMVHVNEDDGSRIFIPFAGGMGEYVPKVREATARGHDGLVFRRSSQ